MKHFRISVCIGSGQSGLIEQPARKRRVLGEMTPDLILWILLGWGMIHHEQVRGCDAGNCPIPVDTWSESVEAQFSKSWAYSAPSQPPTGPTFWWQQCTKTTHVSFTTPDPWWTNDETLLQEYLDSAVDQAQGGQCSWNVSSTTTSDVAHCTSSGECNDNYTLSGGYQPEENAGCFQIIMNDDSAQMVRYLSLYQMEVVESSGLSFDHTTWESDDGCLYDTIDYDYGKPFDNKALRSQIMKRLPAFPPGDGNFALGGATASYTLSVRQSCGDGTRARYKFGLWTDRNVKYKLSWYEVTTDPCGGSKNEEKHENITGNGTYQYGTVHTMEVPEWDGACQQDGSRITTIQNLTATIDPSSGGGTSTSAAPGSSTLTQGLGPTACVSGCGGGGSCRFSWGPAMSLALGASSLGSPAGDLYFNSDFVSTNLANPMMLDFSGSDPDVEVIKVNSAIAQVMAPQALANVDSVTAFKYRIRFYYLNQVGTTKGGDGLYPLNDPNNPFVTWTVENPDASTNSYNTLKIAESRPSTADNVYTYTYSALDGSWMLDGPGGLREDKWTTTIDVGQNTRTVISEVRPQGGSDVLKSTRVYKTFTWGEGLIQDMVGDGASAQTSLTWFNDGGSLTNGHLPILYKFDQNGHWQRFGYDDQMRPTNSVSQFLNVSTNAADSQCRVITNSYAGLPGTQDGNTNVAPFTAVVDPYTPRSTTELLLGTVISRSYTIIEPTRRLFLRCVQPNSTWVSTDINSLLAGKYLVTTNNYYTTGSFSNCVMNTDLPDGTRTAYIFSSSGSGVNAIQTNVTLVGSVDPGSQLVHLTDILSGKVTTDVIDYLGHILSHTVTDKATSTVLDQDTYSYLDTFSRSYTVTHLNGRSNTVQYSCCGIDNTTDEDGTIAQYQYDALKRYLGTTITSYNPVLIKTNVLDAAGEVLANVRNGTFTQWYSFDLAGRMASETNALLGTTSYTQTYDGSGQLVKTTTYPDAGTRIETYAKDGSLVSIAGTAVAPVNYTYGLGTMDSASLQFRGEVRLAADGGTNEWSCTWTDFLGRDYKTVYAAASGTPYRQSFYNNRGQRSKERDPDDVRTLYQYDSEGRVQTTAIDMDRNDTIELGNGAGSDRVTQQLWDVTTYSGYPVRRAQTWAYTTVGSAATNIIAMSQTSTDGLRSWQTVYRDGSTPVTTASVTSYGANGARTVTVTQPDNSTIVSLYSYGRLQSVTRKNSGGTQVGKTTYAYDSAGRQITLTDARNGATSLTYNNADQVVTSTAPASGAGDQRQVTTTFYDTMGRVLGQQQPDASTTTNSYYLTGLLKQTSGARVYPVFYMYDAQGRMRTNQTWQSFSAGTGTATTRWNYDIYRGWLTSKEYPDPITGLPAPSTSTNGPSYTYSPAGRLATRTWVRSGLTTTYSTNTAGDLYTITYSDTTPGTTNTYDRRGRLATVFRNGITTTVAFTDAGQPLTESYSGGTLNGLSVNSTYNAYLQRDGVTAKNGLTVLQSASYGYDTAGRLSTVTDSPFTATYAYLANSPLAQSITFAQNPSGMVTTKTYDYLNRLQSISSKGTGGGATNPPASYGYQYNSANQRTRMALADGSYWIYRYDSLGQVISGKRYWADGTPVAGQQFEYGFDDIGNRSSSKTGGDAAGTSLRSATCTPNKRNQYDSRTGTRYVDVLGQANPTAAVTVNGNAAYRRGEYFDYALNIPGSNLTYQTITTTSGYGAGQSQTGSVYFATSTEPYFYDSDGNLISDGRWTNRWDAENRLIEMVSLTNAPTASKRWLKFEYDWQGRRILKTTCVWTNSAWSLVLSNKFLYDGWNLLAELNGTNNSVIRTYVWGADLSGSIQDAGGVGGLLLIKPASSPSQFAAYDGNGNVAALVDTATGSTSGVNEYGPFGEVIRATGPMAKANPFRFSTKYQDDETDLLYYGYRYYNASTGRWLSRDPLEEADGPAIYTYTQNDPVDFSDPFGLRTCRFTRFDFELGQFMKWIPGMEDPTKYGNIAFRAQITRCDACCSGGRGSGYDAQVAVGVAGKIETPKVHPISWAPFIYLQGDLSANFNVNLQYNYCPNSWSGGGCGTIQLGGKIGVDRIIPPSWSVYGGASGGCTLCVKADQLSPKVHVTLKCFLAEQVHLGIRFGRRSYSHVWLWQQSTDENEINSFSVD